MLLHLLESQSTELGAQGNSPRTVYPEWKVLGHMASRRKEWLVQELGPDSIRHWELGGIQMGGTWSEDGASGCSGHRAEVVTVRGWYEVFGCHELGLSLGWSPDSYPCFTGVVQSIKDHITKPTAMARGRVAHLIEWKGWSAQQSGWELSPAEDEHYCCLPDELCEARFAAGEWRGTEREATGWVYSLKVGLSEQAVNAQDWGRGTRWLLYHPGTEGQLREAHVGIERPLLGPVLTESNLVSPLPPPPSTQGSLSSLPSQRPR